MPDTGTLTDVPIITSALKDSFQKGIDYSPAMAGDLFSVETSATAQNVYTHLNHIPGMRQWVKGTPDLRRNIETSDFTVANLRYGNTIALQVDDINDNQLGQYNNLAQQMGNRSVQKKDALIYGLLNDAFDGTLVWDGGYLCAATHTVGISTVNNAITAALTSASFETAYNMITGFTFQADQMSDEEPLNPGGKYLLVVPPALQITARGIVKNALGTAGATNSYFGLADVHVSSYLTSSTAWFIVNVGDMIKPFIYQEREAARLLQSTPTNGGTELSIDEIVYNVKMRGAAAATHPWLVVGSTGATT